MGSHIPNNQPKPVPGVVARAQSIPVPSEHFDGQNLVTVFQSSHTIWCHGVKRQHLRGDGSRILEAGRANSTGLDADNR
jgi:hypothetical protein